MGHDANPSFAVKSYTSLPTLTPPPFAILINVVLQALKDINFAVIRVLAAHDLQVVTRTCPTYFIINSSVTFGCDCADCTVLPETNGPALLIHYSTTSRSNKAS